MGWRFAAYRITLAREANSVSPTELAGLIGATPQQVAQWEAGKFAPSQDSLMKICNALKTPPRFFFVQSGHNVNYGNPEAA